MTNQCKKLRNILRCALLVCASATLSLPYAQGQDQSGEGATAEPLPTRWMSSDGSVRMPHAVPVTPERFEMVPVAPRKAVKRSQDGILPPAIGERICLVVDNAVYANITAGLNTFIADLEAEGYVVITYRFVSGGATELRDSLIKLYNEPQSLAGAQFIGAIPHIVFEMMQDWGSESEEYEDFPCDMFFMDLHGTWSDVLDYGSVKPGNGKYDTWSGDRRLDIWVSRLKTDNLPALGTSAQILTKYFMKNHAWRQRSLAPAQTALLYIDDDWAKGLGPMDLNVMRTVYDPDSITSVTDPEGTSAADYKTNRLPAVGEMLFTRSHGNPTGHGYYTNSKETFGFVYPSDYRTIVPDALFHSFFVCSGTDFTVSGNLAGSVVFNEGTGLLAWGSTKTGGMYNDQYFYGPVSEGKCFGEGFKNWFNVVRNFTTIDNDSLAPSWWYGMALIGDGTLRPSVQTFKLAVSLPESADEGDGTIEGAASVTLPWPLDADMMVGLESSDPTELTVPESLLIPAGSKSVTFPITVIDDHISDAIQPVTVTVSANHWVSGSDNMTISDRGVLIRFTAETSVSNESDAVVPITLSLSEAAPVSRTARYSIASGGTATDGGVDVDMTAGTVIFHPTETEKTIYLSVTDDALDEDDETVRIALVNILGSTPVDTTFHTVTIMDNDDAPLAGFADPAIDVREHDTTLLIPVLLDARSGRTVRATFSVTGGTATNGGVDYTAASTTLTFAPGDTVEYVPVELFDDIIEEDNETVVMGLSTLVNAQEGENMSTALTILYNDRRMVSFSAPEAQGPESLTVVTVNVCLNLSSTLPVSVSYGVTGGSASNGGIDYTLESGTLSFAPGDTVETITLSVVNDGVPEPDETIVIKLEDAVNITLADDSLFTYTIGNDDVAPQITSDSAVNAVEDEEFVYLASVFDPSDTPLVTFGTIPSWLDTTGILIQGTPANGDGDTLFTVIAFDGYLSDTLTVRVTVEPVNDTPRIVSDPVTVATEHEEYRYDVDATDPDEGDTLLFSLLVAPHNMTIDSLDGEILWVPGSGQTGDTTVVVKVSDRAFACDTQHFTVSVSNTDDPPQFVSAQSDTARQGEPFVYHARAIDPDGTVPSYIFELLPSWLVADGDSIYGTPKRGDNDTVVRVIASDGELYDTLMLAISVNPTLNGAPVCLIAPIPSLCRDVISIHYTLSDPENELLRLELFYEYEGEWVKSSHTSGVIENIIPSAYGGTLLWMTPEHFPAIKTDSLRIKLVPFDADSGIAAISNRFVIDNRALARVNAHSPAGLLAPDGRSSITVTFSTDGIDTEAVENGAVSITGSESGELSFEASVNGAQLALRPGRFLVATETLTVSITQDIFPSDGSLLDCNGNGRHDEEADDTFRIKIPVSRLGDFNLDGDVNFGDLSYLSSYWYASASGDFDADSVSETGPISGEAPLFLVDPDNRFDFEDIDAFIHMWHWSHEHPDAEAVAAKQMAWRSGCAKQVAQPAGTVPARAAAIQKASLQQIQCGGTAALRLALDVENVSELVACSYSISFDPRTVAPIDIGTSHLLESKNGRAIAMKSEASGSLDLDMVRLCATNRDVSGSGKVAEITFAKKTAKAGATLTVSYTLINSSHEPIESRSITLDLSDTELNGENFADGRLRVAPNPSKAASSAKPFRFADNSSAQSVAGDERGGFVFLFDIAGRKDVSNTAAMRSVAVSGYIKIYNAVGSPVASTPQGTINASCGNSDCRPFSVYWDGRASNGSLLAPGVYHAVLVYSSKLGSGKMSTQVGIKR